MLCPKISANQHKLGWANIRSTIDLIARNKVYTKNHTAQILKLVKKDIDNQIMSNVTSLELLNIIYPPAQIKTFKDLGLDGLSYKDKRIMLGHSVGSSKLITKDSPLDRLNKMLKYGSYQSRKTNWHYRIGSACKDLIHWHPFFVTLTVDPKKIDSEQLWTERKEWQIYIKSLGELSMRSAGLTKRQRRITSVRHYLQYVALIEHGKSGHHHHIHCLIFLKNIPESFKTDPNQTLTGKYCVNRRCLPLEKYWPWSNPGLSPVIYFRFIGDIWSKYGHKIPINKGKPLMLTPPELAGAYLLKYMHKAQERKFCHRIKATQSLGLKQLKTQINSMSLDHLQQLSIRPPTHSQNLFLTTTLIVPIGLLRSVIKMRIYEITYQTMDLRTLLKPTPKPYLKMLSSVKNGMKPWRYNTSQLYIWLRDVLPIEKIGFCKKIWLEAINSLSILFRANFNITQTIGAL